MRNTVDHAQTRHVRGTRVLLRVVEPDFTKPGASRWWCRVEGPKGEEKQSYTEEWLNEGTRPHWFEDGSQLWTGDHQDVAHIVVNTVFRAGHALHAPWNKNADYFRRWPEYGASTFVGREDPWL